MYVGYMTMTMSISHFLRNSGSALSEVDDHDLLLERRDGADIYLKRADRQQADQESLTAGGRMMAVLLANETTRHEVLERIEEVLPWTTFLPASEVELFTEEFIRVIKACAEIGNFTPAGITLRQWKNTAEVHADAGLNSALRAPIEAGRAVQRPARSE